MTCFNPIPAWRDDEPNPKTGRTPLRFNKHADQLHSDLDIPCGRCVGCRGDRARDWGVRIYHESLLYEQSSFLTLTYDEDHNDGTLHKEHVQEFVNNLRNNPDAGWRPRYFACGEYGEKTRRPHYHAIVFGTDFHDILSTAIDDDLWQHPVVSRAWRYGHHSIAAVEPAAAMYVAGYVQKKATDSDTFNLMSRGSRKRTNGMLPPIGFRYAERHLENLNRLGFCVIGDRRHPIPSVYFDWFPDSLGDAKAERKAMTTHRNGAILRRRETNYRGRMAGRSETI